MAILQIRDIPEPLYRRLKRLARQKHRSLSQQAVSTLSKVFDMAENPKERRHRILQNLTDEPLVKRGEDLPAPVKLIREDRDR